MPLVIALVWIALTATSAAAREPLPIVTCNSGPVAYRVHARPGTVVEYAGSRYTIGASGRIELIASPRARTLRVGKATLSLSGARAEDAQGTAEIGLEAMEGVGGR